MSYRRSSFNYTTGQRRSSVVVDNLGRAGIFTPSDFQDEEQGLNTVIDQELINEEVQLLQENGIAVPKYSLTQAAEVEQVWNDAVKDNKLNKLSYGLETKTLIKSSIPMIITFTLEYSLSVASIFSVGHLGSTELLAVSLGAMSLNISLYSIIQGMASSLDTLCSQLYGAGNYRMVAVYFQKCTMVIFCCYIPIFVLYWTYGYWVLSKLILDPTSALLLSKYLQLVSMGIPGFILFETGKRFLQCQGIFHASTYILCFCAPLNALMNYLLVWNKYIGIGYLGAPILILIDFWLMAIGLLIYTVKTDNPINPMKCWLPIDWLECFRGWRELFGLAMPGVIMIELEFLLFELLTLLLSYLGTESLALQSIIVTVLLLSYQVPYLISIAAGTRVANLLGAGLVPMTKVQCKVTLIFGIMISLFNCSIIFIGDVKLARLFTNDEQTILVVSKVLPLIAMIQIFDALNLVSAGLLRGQGLQKIGGIVNLISYYLIGIPSSVVLCFHYEKGLMGLWIGAGLALFIIGMVQSYFVLNADYDQLVKDLKRRNEQ